MMKKIIIAGLCIILAGCESPTKKEEASLYQNAQSEKIEASKKGEVCGGREKKKCLSGLECKYEKNSNKGVCQESVKNSSIKCEDEKSPVCAVKDKNRNGYQNSCEAERHGAEILHKGFCKPNEKVPGNCNAFAESIGNCNKEFQGYEFNGELCEKVLMVGCDADIPFKTQEECVKKCINKNTETQNKKESSEKQQSIEVEGQVDEEGTVRITLPKIDIIDQE